MINWLTERIGTGAYLEVTKIKGDHQVVDVTGLVDKDGNTNEAIIKKINEALIILEKGSKVVICCDYGMSRSNSIAAGVIAKFESVPFSQAVSLVQKKIAEQGVKLEVLDAVYRALNYPVTIDGNAPERILVTGGTGFIGTRLTKKIANSYFVKSLSSKEVDLINNPVSLDFLIKENGITTLIHLANPRIYTVNIAMGDSLVMLKNVLEVCRINNTRLIYISSWETYSGYRADELIADERLPLFPKGSYGESKWLAEQMLQHYQKTYGLKYVTLRSSPVYGEGSDRPKFIYNFIDKARRNENIVTHKYLNGYPKLDLLYVDDFITALEKVISFKGFTDFNLGSGRLISTRQIAEIIVDLVNSKSTIQSNSIDTYYSNIKMDHSKARDLLGWEIGSAFETAIKKILQ